MGEGCEKEFEQLVLSLAHVGVVYLSWLKFVQAWACFLPALHIRVVDILSQISR